MRLPAALGEPAAGHAPPLAGAAPALSRGSTACDRRSPADRQGRGARARGDPGRAAHGARCEGAGSEAARDQPADARQEDGGSGDRSVEPGRRWRRRAVNLLCPACHTPLPPASAAVVSCPALLGRGRRHACRHRRRATAFRPRGRPDRHHGERLPDRPRVSRAAAWARSIARPAPTGSRSRSSSCRRRWHRTAKSSPGSRARSPCWRAWTTPRSCACAPTARWTASPGSRWIWSTEPTCARASRAARCHRRRPPRSSRACWRRWRSRTMPGVVHRDLKPANLLLAPDGARLADFGVARWDAEVLAGSDALTRLTETAAVIGTLPYMSPEQRRGGAVDRRSDLFSTGVMLYEVSTGALPQGAFPPPSALNRAYGRAFDRLVLRLLQPDPARRPELRGRGGGVARRGAAAARGTPAPLRHSRRRAGRGACRASASVGARSGARPPPNPRRSRRRCRLRATRC